MLFIPMKHHQSPICGEHCQIANFYVNSFVDVYMCMLFRMAELHCVAHDSGHPHLHCGQLRSPRTGSPHA